MNYFPFISFLEGEVRSLRQDNQGPKRLGDIGVTSWSGFRSLDCFSSPSSVQFNWTDENMNCLWKENKKMRNRMMKKGTLTALQERRKRHIYRRGQTPKQDWSSKTRQGKHAFGQQKRQTQEKALTDLRLTIDELTTGSPNPDFITRI